MIYLPIELSDNYCVTFYDSNTIRVYDNNTIVDNQINYTDYYINSHYINNSFYSELPNNLNCISHEKITNNWKYRNDLKDILIISTLLCILFFGVPLFLISKLFKKKI